MANTVASRKQKGRVLQQAVVELILSHFPDLTVNDVRSVPSGVPGTDVWLSEAAKRCLNIDDIECKNCEKINIWGALAQMEERNTMTSTHLSLIFKRNRSRIWATVPVEFLFELLQKVYNGNKNV